MLFNQFEISFIFALLFSVVLFFFFLLFQFFKRLKNQYFLRWALSYELLEINIPPVVSKEKEKEIQLQEYLKNIENFFSSLAGIGVKGGRFFKLLVGSPVFCFEIAVPRIGEETHFYVACPRYLSELVEKQILSYWPRGAVNKSPDYNIFNPDGYSLASRAMLASHSVFPLKSAKEFRQDPISSVLSVMTKLAKEGEGAAIQIMIKKSKKNVKKIGRKVSQLLQSGKDLREALVEAKGGVFREVTKALFSPSTSAQKQKQSQDFQTPPSSKVTPVQQEIITAIDQKANLPIFDTNIRIVTSAPTQERAETILSQLESAFYQFASSLNSFKFLRFSGKKAREIFYHFSFRIFDEKTAISLSAEELANIFHPPLPTLFAPFVKWLKSKEAPAPPNLPKEGLIIGKNVFRGEEKIIRILQDDRRRHFYMIGQTGTGKSSLILEMVRQDIQNGAGVGLIDPHGDLAERVLGFVPPERVEDVVYFNPADFERPIGLNMLEYDPNYPESKTFIVNEILEIFDKLYNLKAMGFGGPVYEQYMRNALLLVMEHPESGNTLLEIPRVLADTPFRKLKLSHCKNIVVKDFWEKEAEKAGGEFSLANLVPYITSKMNVFIANDLVRPIISQEKSTINFRQIMDEGKILIVNLSKGKLGDVNSYLLGMIIIGKLLLAAFSRIDTPEEQRKDFFLYIDEFQNVVTKTITSALAEARKFRLSLILAHQFIGQLDEETKKAIFGNIGTILTFRVGPDDAKYLVTQFGPVFEEQDLVNFDNYRGGIRLLINGVTSTPFSFETFPPAKPNPEIAEIVKNISRHKYGRSREIVERELQERLTKSFGRAF